MRRDDEIAVSTAGEGMETGGGNPRSERRRSMI